MSFPRRRVLWGSSRISTPLMSAKLSEKRKSGPITAGKCTLNLDKFLALLSSRKDQKGLMKGEDLTVLEQTTQLTNP